MTLYRLSGGRIHCDYCHKIYSFDRLEWVESFHGGNSGWCCPCCNKVTKQLKR